jgi:hypothetical protein
VTVRETAYANNNLNATKLGLEYAKKCRNNSNVL